MSWGVFRSNMLRYMKNPTGVSSPQAYAKKITFEYDMCMRRGIQGINLCSVQKGNTQAMESLIAVTLVQCFANPGPALSPLIKNLGSAFKAYWAGATMNPFPIPPIPAPGAIQNIVVTQNLCINPGTWVAQFPTPPVLSSAFLVDFIILAAQIHLLTLKGMIYTTSMYPAAPSPVPAPGVIQWSGYIIPGGFGRDGDDDDNSDGEPNSDWQPLNTDNVPNSKPFVEGALFNSGDVVEYDGKFYIAQNPEKNGERCWNVPF